MYNGKKYNSSRRETVTSLVASSHTSQPVLLDCYHAGPIDSVNIKQQDIMVSKNRSG